MHYISLCNKVEKYMIGVALFFFSEIAEESHGNFVFIKMLMNINSFF